MIEKLKELIENSNLSEIEKSQMVEFVTKSDVEEKIKTKDKFLIETTTEHDVDNILFACDYFIIYTKRNDSFFEDGYPVRSIYRDNRGFWSKSISINNNFDRAMLKCLEMKHLGYNSEFTEFACKMLGIES
jgi:hypothetical protein